MIPLLLVALTAAQADPFEIDPYDHLPPGEPGTISRSVHGRHSARARLPMA